MHIQSADRLIESHAVFYRIRIQILLIVICILIQFHILVMSFTSGTSAGWLERRSASSRSRVLNEKKKLSDVLSVQSFIPRINMLNKTKLAMLIQQQCIKGKWSGRSR